MKLLIGSSLLVAGTACLTLSSLAITIAMPTTLDGRAVFLLALAAGGFAFGVMGVRELRRNLPAEPSRA